MASSDDDAASAIKMKLMDCNEVYVYKIPPLTKAGGHRAEDWDLAKPLKTCQLLCEQRGNALFIDFMDAKVLFCQAQIDLVKHPELNATQNWLEPVVDSSRYFVIKIGDQASGREALIGFGFRDREKATDLREAVQHYEKTTKRETQAAVTSAAFADFTVPQLAEGEKIHVDPKTGKTTIMKKDGKSAGGGGVPLLKKKPPATAAGAPADISEAADDDGDNADAATLSKDIDKVAIQFGDINLVDVHATGGVVGGEDGSDDDSGHAIYEGDEQQWATEFAMK